MIHLHAYLDNNAFIFQRIISVNFCIALNTWILYNYGERVYQLQNNIG